MTVRHVTYDYTLGRTTYSITGRLYSCPHCRCRTEEPMPVGWTLTIRRDNPDPAPDVLGQALDGAIVLTPHLRDCKEF